MLIHHLMINARHIVSIQHQITVLLNYIIVESHDVFVRWTCHCFSLIRLFGYTLNLFYVWYLSSSRAFVEFRIWYLVITITCWLRFLVYLIMIILGLTYSMIHKDMVLLWIQKKYGLSWKRLFSSTNKLSIIKIQVVYIITVK